MHNFIVLAMGLNNSGSLTWSWYDVLFGALAATAVFSDKIIACMGKLIGKELGWRCIAWVAGVAVGFMIIATLALMPFYPELQWWYPLIFVGSFMLLQVLVRLVRQLQDLGIVRRDERDDS